MRKRKSHTTGHRFLFIQIRKEKKIAHDEIVSYCQLGKINRSELHVVNVFETPHFSTKMSDKFDAVIIGGASGTSVCDITPSVFYSSIIELVSYCISVNKPLFGTCYGFQVLAIAAGGHVYREQKPECGHITINTTNKISSDHICHTLPSTFDVISIHRDFLLELPDTCDLLAYNDNCIQAIKIKNKPLWGFQFHPENIVNLFKPRFLTYGNEYTNSTIETKRIAKSIKNTPEANQLIFNFVTLVRKQHKNLS